MVELVIVWHPSNNWEIIQIKGYDWESVTKLTFNIMLLISYSLGRNVDMELPTIFSNSQFSFSSTVIILTFWSSCFVHFPLDVVIIDIFWTFLNTCSSWHSLRKGFIYPLTSSKHYQSSSESKGRWTNCVRFCSPFLLIIPRADIQKNGIQHLLFCLRGGQ